MKEHKAVLARRLVIVLLALALCFGAAAEEDGGLLGKPFEDFTAVDTEGNPFVLSEALKDHDAVLINIWATWCNPCRMDMPFLNEAYAQYGDRVAFIALSCEETDTLEKIEAYRQELGLRFPMGRDEGGEVYRALGAGPIPATVVVDRFGNAAFFHIGSFISAGEVMRVLDAFLGDGYAETAVLTGIPRDSSTRAFPAADRRMIHVENESAECVLFSVAGNPEPQPVYLIHDDVAHLRLELSASDDPAEVTYYSLNRIRAAQDLLDADRNAYFVDEPMPDKRTGEYYAYACLTGGESDDAGACAVYLLSGDEYLETLAEEMRSWGYDVTWEYAEPEPAAQDAAQAYRLHIVDQFGDPVPGAAVNFCTDTACVLRQSDEDGTISFDGAPDDYHVRLLKVPEGYSFDPDFELYTGRDYGEWRLRVRRDEDGESR